MTATSVVVIAGPSCSGKTTLANALADGLGRESAAILSLDDYYLDLSAMAFEARAAQNFDDPDAIDATLLFAHVARLASGESIDAPIYRFDTHTRDALTRPIACSRFLIVEGLHALHWEELCGLAALRVFVELDREGCLARRVARDVHERGRTVESVRRQFVEHVVPMYERHVWPRRRMADLVVRGDGVLDEPVQRIVSALTRTRDDSAK